MRAAPHERRVGDAQEGASVAVWRGSGGGGRREPSKSDSERGVVATNSTNECDCRGRKRRRRREEAAKNEEENEKGRENPRRLEENREQKRERRESWEMRESALTEVASHLGAVGKRERQKRLAPTLPTVPSLLRQWGIRTNMTRRGALPARPRSFSGRLRNRQSARSMEWSHGRSVRAPVSIFVSRMFLFPQSWRHPDRDHQVSGRLRCCPVLPSITPSPARASSHDRGGVVSRAPCLDGSRPKQGIVSRPGSPVEPLQCQSRSHCSSSWAGLRCRIFRRDGETGQSGRAEIWAGHRRNPTPRPCCGAASKFLTFRGKLQHRAALGKQITQTCKFEAVFDYRVRQCNQSASRTGACILKRAQCELHTVSYAAQPEVTCERLELLGGLASKRLDMESG